MIRWIYLRGALVATLLFAVALVERVVPVSATSVRGHGDPTNFVIVLTDDQTVEQMRFLPQTLELVGERGMMFTTAYVANPVCCPSRVSLLTGQYPHNHGVWSNDTRTGGGYQRFLGQDRTLPVALQHAGYSTAYIGKYLNGYGLESPTEVPPGWTSWWGSVDPSTYRSYGFTLNENGRLRTYPESPTHYQTDVYARLASRYIRAQRDGRKPFFLVVAPAQPHVTRPDGGACSVQCPLGPPMPLATPPPAHNGRYADAILPTPPSFGEVDLSDKPTHTVAHQNARPTPFSLDVQRDIERAYRAEADSLAGIDDLVATIDRALVAANLEDDTFVIFTSDNGSMHGEHGLIRGKEMPYEEATRVPLLIRGPGVAPGSIAEVPTVNVDLAPTILDLAGGRSMRRPDGRSLVPVLRDPARQWDRPVLVEAHHPGPGFASVRDGSFVLIRWGDGQRELYDLHRDPYQTQNLAHDPGQLAVMARLESKLDVLVKCAGASCRSVR